MILVENTDSIGFDRILENAEETAADIVRALARTQ